MIVSDDTVSKALAYLAEDPHPLAIAQQDAMVAERCKDEMFAKLYLAAEGPVKERESVVMVNDRYAECVEDEITALYQVERHKRRVKAAEKILDIYQTQSANVRAAESIR